MKGNGKVGRAVNRTRSSSGGLIIKIKFEVMFSTVSNENQPQQLCVGCSSILACCGA